ncbi:endodeoxyribonuclease RusA [Marinobacter adhaerens]|uniref:endodeoxyribonuclease RusA n=1 Tax=Marinobacter adhaerens TaxID=1033846 RepID=UPI003D2C783D
MPDKLEIVLPWPPKALNPNARGHWSKKAKAAEMYRYTCRVMAREVINKGRWDLKPLRDLVEAGGQIHVFLDFCPPNRRARDDDNIIAAFKAGRDGLADALKIDDCHFRTHPFLKRDEIVKPDGEVRVVVTGKGPEA